LKFFPVFAASLATTTANYPVSLAPATNPTPTIETMFLYMHTFSASG
jgi:hypothetical protein